MKERTQKDSQKEQLEAEQPIINPGGFGNRLLLTQGNGYVFAIHSSHEVLIGRSRYPAQVPQMMPNGTGMPPMGVPPVS